MLYLFFYVFFGFLFISKLFLTHLTSRNSGSEVTSLQSLWYRSGKHVSITDSCQPEGEFVCKIVTSSSGPITLYKWSRAEVFETGTWTGQRLSPSFSPCCCVLEYKQNVRQWYSKQSRAKNNSSIEENIYHSKAVANPEAIPICWTFWYIHVLTVNGYHICLYLTHYTSRIGGCYL